ncbi:MAG TPA: flagellin [Planctomycetota bacterium]|nr:flagellin [Planctomycetota bacterium]
MGLVVNTNIASIAAQRHLSNVTNRLFKNYNHLASGLRITSASDDAAGLAISERLRATISSLGQAIRNGNDGVSLVQTAEGALNEDASLLSRMKELTVQAKNGTVSDADRQTLDGEFQALLAEIDRNADAANFNGVQLLDGSNGSITFQVGDGTDPNVDSFTATLADATTGATGLNLTGLSISSSCSTTLNTVLDALDSALTVVNDARGTFGAAQNRLESTLASLANTVENLSAAESRIRDVDVAYESADLTRNTILQQAATAVLAQANISPQAALSLLRG